LSLAFLSAGKLPHPRQGGSGNTSQRKVSSLYHDDCSFLKIEMRITERPTPPVAQPQQSLCPAGDARRISARRSPPPQDFAPGSETTGRPS
jgi:hypothetical protein